MKLRTLIAIASTTVVLGSGFVGSVSASEPLNILTVGANSGSRVTENYVPTVPSSLGGVSHIGSTVTHVSAGAFNAMTAAQLAAYDVILTQWATTPALDLSSSNVQSYVANGGGLILDGDYLNFNDLSWVGIFGAQSFCSGGSSNWLITAAADPQLSDSLPTDPFLANCHGNFPNFDASVFAVFLEDSLGRNAGLAGKYGAGRIILTGPDHDYHGHPSFGGGEQYQLLLNELEWVGNPLIVVDLDIKPGSYPNSINLSSGGATPVAILGSATLDVNDIDTTSLTLGTSGVKTVGKKDKELCSVSDVSGDFTGGPEGAADGYDDLICHFVTMSIVPEGGDTTASLSGTLIDTTPIEGTDSVNIVP